MANSFDHAPPTVRRYRLPAAVLNDTIRVLREVGQGIKEAVVLWQGRVEDAETAAVTRVIVPRQETGPLHFNVPLRERLRILAEVSSADEFILIQVHTHPRQAFHSEADDRLAITKHTGAISIVVPDFGMLWDGNLLKTSVNRCQGGDRWRELTLTEIADLFEVTE